VVGLLVTLHIEERVAVPQLQLPGAAQRDGGGLAVADQHVAARRVAVILAGQPVLPVQPRQARRSLSQVEKLLTIFTKIFCISPNLCIPSWSFSFSLNNSRCTF
jgi:hypothetical protein